MPDVHTTGQTSHKRRDICRGGDIQRRCCNILAWAWFVTGLKKPDCEDAHGFPWLMSYPEIVHFLPLIYRRQWCVFVILLDLFRVCHENERRPAYVPVTFVLCDTVSGKIRMFWGHTARAACFRKQRVADHYNYLYVSLHI